MPNKQEPLNLLLQLLRKNKKAPPQNASQEEMSRFIMDSLTPAQRSTIEKLMNDPLSAEDFLNNPKVQELMKQLNNQ